MSHQPKRINIISTVPSRPLPPLNYRTFIGSAFVPGPRRAVLGWGTSAATGGRRRASQAWVTGELSRLIKYTFTQDGAKGRSEETWETNAELGTEL